MKNYNLDITSTAKIFIQICKDILIDLFTFPFKLLANCPTYFKVILGISLIISSIYFYFFLKKLFKEDINTVYHY